MLHSELNNSKVPQSDYVGQIMDILVGLPPEVQRDTLNDVKARILFYFDDQIEGMKAAIKELEAKRDVFLAAKAENGSWKLRGTTDVG